MMANRLEQPRRNSGRFPVMGGLQVNHRLAMNRLEQNRLLEVLTASIEITTRDQFITWAKDTLRTLFPYETLVCGLGRVEAGLATQDTLLLIDLPVEYIEAIRGNGGHIASPIIQRWLKTHRPQLFQPGDAPFPVPADWLALFKRFRLRNLAAHGLSDAERRCGSYFSFTGIPGRLTEFHALMLEIIVPHMHQALVRVIFNDRTGEKQNHTNANRLTPREQEIIQLLVNGMTTRAIADQLSRSPHTIKHHVCRILDKLGVNTRAQAVAKAMELRLVSNIAQAAKTEIRSRNAA